MKLFVALWILITIESCTAKNPCRRPKKPCRDVGGYCYPKADYCIGPKLPGRKYCWNSKRCSCCADCEYGRSWICEFLGGTCMQKYVICDGREIFHSKFCKWPERCKCCIPETPCKATTEVPTTISEATTEVPTTISDMPWCPSDFHQVGEQCIMVVPDYLNWAEAREYCMMMGGDLAQVNDQTALANYIIDVYDMGWAAFWVGGSDHGSEGDWQWIDGSDITQGWEPGQPDNYDYWAMLGIGKRAINPDIPEYGEDEDCLYFWPNGAPNGLGDAPCSNEKPFVCQCMGKC